MALSPFSFGSISSNCCFPSSPSYCYFLVRPRVQSPIACTVLRFRVLCSNDTKQVELERPRQTKLSFEVTKRVLRFRVLCSNDTKQVELERPRRTKLSFEVTKRKRKPRPSFLEQIQEKWQMKNTSSRERFPWQEERENQEEEEDEVEESEQSSGICVTESNVNRFPPVSDSTNFASLSRSTSAPWVHGSRSKQTQVDWKPEIFEEIRETGEDSNMLDDNSINDNTYDVPKGRDFDNLVNGVSLREGILDEEVDEIPSGVLKDEEKNNLASKKSDFTEEKPLLIPENFGNFVILSNDFNGSTGLPWEKDKQIEYGVEDRKRRRTKTEQAETRVPKHELQRLRNLASRMLERTKVGVAGITQKLVESILEKWKEDEVVKLKFEGPLSFNMKQTQELLQDRTGGLAIWRSGSSVVLYRGMGYNLPCVQTFNLQNQTPMNIAKEIVVDSVETRKSILLDEMKYPEYLSEEEIIALGNLNQLLDELGPRFKDWSGREPLPVDADLLPAVVYDYKPPVRLLPYRVKHCLRDRDVTTFRRLARTMPPHFALGRNRELQGLADAIVKLWESSAIAKIAIKRGVENTRNDRMAEELKRLTGGTLLSRNKEYIVLYRGNDFMPSSINEELKERRKLADVQQDVEEQARQAASTSIASNVKSFKGTLVAGTLAETIAATSRWGIQPSREDIQNMRRDSAVTRYASLVRHLEKKLDLAKWKVKKAEKTLGKLQEDMDPSELPNDLETISDEERFLLRRMGLSMKPFLLLGRRGVYDGTIENMHLHWKFRELVKIIVKRKSYEQVKHIAISLEAESGGLLVSVDKTTEGHTILVYRGKNYRRPDALRPKNLLTRRQALARAVELQRREALKHHILDLEEKIQLLKSELEAKSNGTTIDRDAAVKLKTMDAAAKFKTMAANSG